MSALLVGAVAYDPKVVTIWEGFRHWFASQGLPIDFVLYSHYERQVEAHLAGHVDVAWNSPLAFVQTERLAAAEGRRARAIAMRDTDQDLRSVVVVRADAHARTLAELRSGRVAVGAADSPQATLLPLQHFADAGLEPGRDFHVKLHDRLVGLHGDHVGGEREAARALMAGTVDAACMIDGNYLLFGQDGTLPPGATRVLAHTAPYDHCCFTVLDGADPARVGRFTELLRAQSYQDPAVRHLLDLEGLREWRAGRDTGFAALRRAADRFGAVANLLARRR
jgi:phosphonate transport system substrate-binding protein